MKKVLMFDFDGVIVDSFELNLATHQKHTPTTTADKYRELFKGNIYATHQAEENLLENQRVLDFFSAYETGLMDHECVPGIQEAIKKLAEAYTLVIISSTTFNPINNFLKKHDLSQYFKEILGLEAGRSKTNKIKLAFDKYQTNENNCLFITDTLGDIREADKVDVKCIAVTWGFHFKEMLEEGNPLGIAETPKQLEVLIKSSL